MTTQRQNMTDEKLDLINQIASVRKDKAVEGQTYEQVFLATCETFGYGSPLITYENGEMTGVSYIPRVSGNDA